MPIGIVIAVSYTHLHSYEPALACVKELVKIAPVYYANGNHEERMKLKPQKLSLIHI